MMSILRKLWIVLFILFFSLKGIAQKKTEDQSLAWLRYQLKLNLNPQWQVIQEIEERAYWFPWRQHQFLTRTTLNRKMGKGWNAGVAFTYLEQSLPHDPDVKDIHNRTELRPQVEIAYKQTISESVSVSHRYWSEFRFIEQENGSFKYTNNRSRYKLELAYAPHKDITLKAFDEIFLNIGSDITYNVFDQNRYGVSVQYMPFENIGVELGYINWFQQRSSGDEFYNRNIVRLTLSHTIDFKNNRNK